MVFLIFWFSWIRFARLWADHTFPIRYFFFNWFSNAFCFNRNRNDAFIKLVLLFLFIRLKSLEASFFVSRDVRNQSLRYFDAWAVLFLYRKFHFLSIWLHLSLWLFFILLLRYFDLLSFYFNQLLLFSLLLHQIFVHSQFSLLNFHLFLLL